MRGVDQLLMRTALRRAVWLRGGEQGGEGGAVEGDQGGEGCSGGMRGSG